MQQLLNDAIEDYMSLRGTQDYAKGTLRNERSVLMRLLTTSGNIYVHKMGEAHATRYFEDAGKTRNSRALGIDFTVLTQFFEWARQTRRMPLDVNPMIGRRRPKITHRERRRITVTEFPRLLDVAEERCPRDRMAIALLIYLLVRDNEATDLRVGDVDLVGGRVFTRITKSRTEDLMPICAELDKELRDWLSFYTTTLGRPLNANDYLLPRMQSQYIHRAEGGRIQGHEMRLIPTQSMGRLGRIVKPILEGIGFPVVDHQGNTLFEGAHTIRRSAARALFDRLCATGYDRSLRLVKEMMHHSSSAQTEKYIGIQEDRRSRDEILRGQTMYPIDLSNVTELVG